MGFKLKERGFIIGIKYCLERKKGNNSYLYTKLDINKNKEVSKFFLLVENLEMKIL